MPCGPLGRGHLFQAGVSCREKRERAAQWALTGAGVPVVPLRSRQATKGGEVDAGVANIRNVHGLEVHVLVALEVAKPQDKHELTNVIEAHVAPNVQEDGLNAVVVGEMTLDAARAVLKVDFVELGGNTLHARAALRGCEALEDKLAESPEEDLGRRLVDGSLEELLNLLVLQSPVVGEQINAMKEVLAEGGKVMLGENAPMRCIAAYASICAKAGDESSRVVACKAHAEDDAEAPDIVGRSEAGRLRGGIRGRDRMTVVAPQGLFLSEAKVSKHKAAVGHAQNVCLF